MGFLGITAVSAGAVDYLLRGSGCAEHEHQPSPAEVRDLDRDGPSPAGGAAAGAQASGAGYLLAAAEKEPPGVWFGSATQEMLGIAPGTAATERDVRLVFGKLLHPSSTADEPKFLGRPPRKFKNTEERVRVALAKEPDAGEERRREIEAVAAASGRKAVAYYDLTFSPQKSVSILHAALRSERRYEDAQAVVDVHRAALAEAMAFVEREAAYTRSGYHGKTAGGQSVGRFDEATGLVWTRWDHSTNRNQEPQLHTHVAVLNRVINRRGGGIQALDGKGFKAIKFGAVAVFDRALEKGLSDRLGVVMALRPDGKSREIIGIDQQLCDAASSRARQVEGNLERRIEEFRERHGREPSPAERKNMWGLSKLEDRAHKTGDIAPSEQLDNWAAPRRDELANMLAAMGAQADQVRRHGHPDQRKYVSRSREEALQAAVDAVQTRHATWDFGLLQAAIGAEQLRTPSLVGDLADLTYEVLRDAGRYGVVTVSMPDPGEVPVELQRADGKSIYRPHQHERYATFAQLATETALVAAARQPGAPALTGPELELARVELVAAGLGADQLDAALGILGSGRAGDVLLGPAGAGKSHTVGALAHAWERGVGGRVIGVATSQRAVQVLEDDGLFALNTARFLNRFAQNAQGHTYDSLRGGDLVVVDEAGMSATGELDRIARLVREAGGKILYTGDPEQLVAVGAGGMLDLLVRDNGAYELTEIRRFHEPWERAASLQLRNRDASVLRLYEDSGRLHGGTREEMVDEAVRGYLADTVRGKDSLLVVSDNAAATELSGMIRAELVARGYVEPEVLGTLRDGNHIGVGDLVQARRNDYAIRVEGDGAVTNRVAYRVTGRNPEDGTLWVVAENGLVAHLPADYVSRHVTLAYASTVHAAQGRTVDVARALVDGNLDAHGLYVAMTRGREANIAYVETRREPDAHNQTGLDTTPRGALADILGRDRDVEASSAEMTRRFNEEEGRSLAFLGTQLDRLAEEYGRNRYDQLLSAAVGKQYAAMMRDEAGHGRLLRTLREAELGGHDVAAVLDEAVDMRRLADAASVSDVLRWRIREHVLVARTAEHDPTEVLGANAPASWADLAARLDGAAGRYAEILAEACRSREAELAEEVATTQPRWVVEHLGPLPEGGPERDEWIHRAGIAAAYRDLRSVPETSVALGEAPSREQTFHRALWQRAYAALGEPADALDYAAASETELRQIRDIAARERTFAPYYVAKELRETRIAAQQYRNDQALYWAETGILPLGSPERERAEAEMRTAASLAAELEARAEHLAAVHAAREAWAVDAARAEQRAQLAGDELEKRGLPRDLAPMRSGEQTALFRVLTPEEAAEPDRGLALADRAQLTLEGSEPVREPYLVAEPAHRRAAEDLAILEEDTASIDPAQEPIFEATPSASDLAAARPLREAEQGQRPDREPVTVREARRQAEILADLNAQRASAGQDPVAEWQRERAQRAETLEQDRERRDQVPDRDLKADRGMTREHEQLVDAGPEMGLNF
ncbi:relaxase domain-containing protein [Pseudonocardia kujensis]|uniref:MobF family relaxase n=1 Tax=Pseudonocardia kujensis TaxID=1128675 RepID=UPI001E3D712D|nr:MobF family relaxase [Pseudonocardia kujensis]MCE0768691.1 relaxase domain-containing protein [Pseudonocardia kujensis]